FEDFISILISYALEFILGYKFQFLAQGHRGSFFLGLLLIFLGQSIFQEFQIIPAVFENIVDDVLDKIFGQIHIAVEITKSHFGFDHPKLGQMTGSIRVFGPESGTESIDTARSEEHTSELQSRFDLVWRLVLAMQ